VRRGIASSERPHTWGALCCHVNSESAMVALKASVSRNVPGEVYEVVRLLPHNGREFEFHIKSSNESHVRVAKEGELARA
jgi:hypothetical protein